jgi:hypothetical protein
VTLYAFATVFIVLAYFVGLKFRKWRARLALAALMIVPYCAWSSPLWLQLPRDLQNGDAGMAIGFMFVLLFPYAGYVALTLVAYSFGKSNKVDMIS